jgi:SNF2 family DNA or RNA helicase
MTLSRVFDSERFFDLTFRDCIRSADDLHDYQREAVDWLWERPFSAIFIDTGMGKTVIIETLLDRLFLAGFGGKVLIIAPIRVCTRVWMREHRLWRHLAYLRLELLRLDDDDPRLRGLKADGRQALRSQLLDSDRQIHVINQEAVDWLVDRWFERGRWPYRVVVFDESSRLRDHNSQVFRALVRVLPKIKRFHELTATPASQTYMHLFSQMYLLDRGGRLGTHITPFRERYFTYNHYKRTWTIRDGAAEEIERRIADICLVMRRKRNFIIHTRRVELPPKSMQQYRTFEEDSVLKIGEEVIDAINGAVLSNKLLQFASGAVYDESKRFHVIHREKIEDLRQLLSETLDNPVMVAYWYKSSLARLRAAFPKAVAMDKEGKAEADWNKGKIKMLLVHPRSVAHGLNLQFGGHHLVLFDIFWPLELFTQLIDRLDRPGQLRTVMVHLLAATNTMDGVVAANLELLRSAEEAMFNRLRAIQRRTRREALDVGAS